MQRTHGMSGGKAGRHRIYRIWANMKSRCLCKTNPRYKDYGGRGITLCKQWAESFEKFYLDVGDPPTNEHSIDRINNNKGYYLSNIRWATRAEQNRNSRRCKFVTIKGESKPINVWCRETGISYCTYKQRIRNGWDIVAAVSTPPTPPGKRYIFK
jgi:hypothetical protein